MKPVRVLSVLLIIVLLVSCTPESSLPEPTPSPTPAPAPTSTPIATTTPEPTPQPTEPVSFTTGLPFDGPYKPVMAVIENAPAARPQTGLQTADIVYEVPVEGSITRFVCVFSDNIPEEILPVRSARVPFIYIQGEWEGILMHYGAAGRKESQWKKDYSVYGHSLYKKAGTVMDGLSSKWNKYFYRTNAAKVPHNVVGKPQLAAELYDYEPTPAGWTFSSSYSYTGEAVTQINLAMCSKDKNYVSYTYDEEKGVYLRFMNGKPFKAAETGEQVHVKNIIVQYSTYSSSTGRKLWKLVGSGKAEYYVGGRLISGSWKRESELSKTVFLDDNGQQIVLAPGNTWVHISP